jgi:uncharacterized membrane protein
MTFSDTVEIVGKCIDAAGVITVVLGAALATAVAGLRASRRQPDTYRLYRQQLGRSICSALNYSSQPTSSAPSPSHPPRAASRCWPALS